MLRGVGLIIWGAICGALFVLLFVSTFFAGRLLSYLLMGACLSAAVLSVSTGRRLLIARRKHQSPLGVG